MSERKVLNKFYPNDYDPSKLPPLKSRDEQQCGVRMMLPMTIRCNSCGQALYVGTKFNMRKEICSDEYLGIKMYRFYMKCTKCYQEITMKTDPRSSDYICEFGATRNYEPWRDIISAVAAYKEQRLDEEEGNVMKSLENKSYDSKKEMDVLDALNEVRIINKRLVNPDYQGMLDLVGKKNEEEKEINDKVSTMKERKIDTLLKEEDNTEDTVETPTEEITQKKPKLNKAIKHVKIVPKQPSNQASKVAPVHKAQTTNIIGQYNSSDESD